MGDELGSLDPVVEADGFDQRDPTAADDFDLAALDQPALDGSELPDVATRSRSTSRPPARARAARARGGQRSLDPVVEADGFDQRDPTAADDFDLAALDQPALDGSDWRDPPAADDFDLADTLGSWA